jgi:flagellar hook-associated protein 1 FlgK
MTLASLLSVARSALLAHERAVSVIGHNIANAETPGYSRQRLDLAAASPETLAGLGQIGRGVEIVDLSRVRNAFFDDSWRRETGLAGQYQTLGRQLTQISGVLGEPGDATLGVSLDDLIDAFNSLASNPVDPTNRVVVAANATALVDQFRSIDQRLDQIGSQIGAELSQTVDDVNAYIDEIQDLNIQIQRAGGKAPDLSDRRDLLVDKLSQLIDVRTIDRGNGTIDVTLSGHQLVSSGGAAQHLAMSGGGPYTVTLGNPPAAAAIAHGQIKGLLDAFTALGTRASPAARATGLRGQLDDLALGIVSAVNQLHSGYDPTTKPLQPTLTPAPAPLRVVGNFFDPNGVTAATIDLDAAIKADPNQIAAGYSTAAGDTSIALRLAGLLSLAVPVPGATGATLNSPAVTAGPAQILGEYYTSLVAGLGVTTRDATTRADSQALLAVHLECHRQEASGVIIAEEMVRLIEHQQAYVAAARLIQVADDMLKELVNLGR